MPPILLSALSNQPALRPPRGLLPPSYGGPGGWVAAGAVGLLLGWMAWRRWRRPRPQPPPLPPPAARARQSLAALQNQPETAALAVEVSRIVRRYVRSVMDLPDCELTTEELMAEVVARPGINGETALALAEFLRECDGIKFASPPPPSHATVTRAGQLIARFESDRPAVFLSAAAAASVSGA